MYTVNNISISFSGTDIFSNATFLINRKDRIGLVGKNGCGKTSLLNIMAGRLEPDTGEIIIPQDKTLGYLPQELMLNNTKSVLEEALSAFDYLMAMEEHIRSLEDDISRRSDYESREYNNLVISLTEANDKYRMIGGHTRDADVEKVLSGLGFTRQEFSAPLNEFSNGWQMRVEIAKLLLRKPDLLLLDEPTNHLDIESIQWLEDFLINYHGALILVSHDRTFLDNVTRRTIEIELGKIYDYKVSYSEYIFLREERLEKQMAAFNNQQRQVRQIERFIERFRYKNTKARQVQSRIKKLKKLDEVEIDTTDNAAIHFYFPLAPASGKVVVEAVDLGKNYDEKQVLTELNFTVVKNDRIAFVGKNGAGKTTLSKIIAGILDHTGRLRLGYNVKLGYFAQNQYEMLDQEATVFETIDRVATGDARPKIRAILGAFLFGEDDIDKKVKVLSGGEKSRLSLAKLLLTPVNLLVLDEPTNHLDMRSKDILKNALLQFQGTLIVVSHDRDFLQGLTNKIFDFREQKVREYQGDIFDFLESRKMQHLRQLEEGHKDLTQDQKGAPSQNKILYEKRKSVEREIRKLTNSIRECETEIEDLEKKIQHLDLVLERPEDHNDLIKTADFYQKYGRIMEDLNNQMALWEGLNDELLAWESKRSVLLGNHTAGH